MARPDAGPVVFSVRGQVNGQFTFRGGNYYRLLVEPTRIVVGNGVRAEVVAFELARDAPHSVILVGTRVDRYGIVRLRGPAGRAELRLARRDRRRIAGVLAERGWDAETMWS